VTFWIARCSFATVALRGFLSPFGIIFSLIVLLGLLAVGFTAVFAVLVLPLINRRRCTCHWLSTSLCTGCCVKDLPLFGVFFYFRVVFVSVWVRSRFSAVPTPCGGPSVLIRAGSVRSYRPFSLRELRVFLARQGVTREC